MKNLNLKYLVMLFAAFTLSISCDKDEDPKEEDASYVGNYTITKATLSSALTLTTNEMGDVSAPAGLDITSSIQTALLGAIECTPENSLIELRDNKSMYMSCEGTTTELNAGTWEEVGATELKLNMNSSAIPSSSSGFVLTVTEVSLINNNLTGKTSVPLPQEMLEEMVVQMSLGKATLNTELTPVVLPVSFSIELTKK